MKTLCKKIRESPLEYLPEVSLHVFAYFLKGYASRARAEGHPLEPIFQGRAFHIWVGQRFGIHSVRIPVQGGILELPGLDMGPQEVVIAHSSTEEAAFYRYFELIEEFEQIQLNQPAVVEGQVPVVVSDAREAADLLPRVQSVRLPDPPKRTFLEEIKAIRERPASHLAHPSFRSLVAYLVGDERAYQDLQLPLDEGRTTFNDFKDWVGAKKNKGLPLPWFKVVRFYGSLYGSKGGSLGLFYDWLDEYAGTIGQPDYFAGAADWRQRQASGP